MVYVSWRVQWRIKRSWSLDISNQGLRICATGGGTNFKGRFGALVRLTLTRQPRLGQRQGVMDFLLEHLARWQDGQVFRDMDS